MCGEWNCLCPWLENSTPANLTSDIHPTSDIGTEFLLTGNLGQEMSSWIRVGVTTITDIFRSLTRHRLHRRWSGHVANFVTFRTKSSVWRLKSWPIKLFLGFLKNIFGFGCTLPPTLHIRTLQTYLHLRLLCTDMHKANVLIVRNYNSGRSKATAWFTISVAYNRWMTITVGGRREVYKYEFLCL